MGKPIVIIGAGIGGLAAAIRLAVAGRQVLVLEQNPQVGGKMYELRDGDFRWDTGPSVITMRHVFAELFASAGRTMEDYLTLLPINPLTRYFYADGTVLDASRDLSEFTTQIEKLHPHDVEGYLAYLQGAAKIHRITGPVFIYGEPPSLKTLTSVPLWQFLQVDPFRTMQQSIESRVRSPQLRQLLGRFATYVGGSPYQAPATLNVIAHVELTGGVWYPQGGVYSIARGMARLAEELGVEIHTDAAVSSILTHGDRVRGVKLANGEERAADAVIANVDVTSVYKYLLPPTSAVQKRLRALAAYEPSCSGFILMLGVDGQHPALAHHNIFFSRDYRAEFEVIFKQGVMPTDPTIYVAITSKTDAEHAPNGSENWFVLVNAPALSDRYDWSVNADAYRDLVLDKLAQRGFDVRAKIRAEHLWTPHDLVRMSGAWRGALYGPSSNSKWTAFRRPNNRSRDVRGLYFAGGSTHPGGGVPMVTLSGKVAAGMVLEDLP